MSEAVKSEVLFSVCDGIADGLSMKEACAKAGVSTKTFCKYLRVDTELGENYTRAREVRSHANSDKIVDVCDKVEQGVLEPDKARVIIDAHKWLAGKWNRKDYGDKVDTDITSGGEKIAPIVSDRDRAKAMLDLLRQAQKAAPESGND